MGKTKSMLLSMTNPVISVPTTGKCSNKMPTTVKVVVAVIRSQWAARRNQNVKVLDLDLARALNLKADLKADLKVVLEVDSLKSMRLDSSKVLLPVPVLVLVNAEEEWAKAVWAEVE